MITTIKLVNFRNFHEKEISLNENKNFIVWNNWKWKTNILEAISILWWNTISWLNFENLCNKDSEYFFIEAINHNNKKISISYDRNHNKKKYLIDKKSVTKKIFKENTYCPVIFSPIIMNMMYLSPSLRRDFLDNILINSYPEYDKILKLYKNIVKNRNKVLKNINENKSEKNEIDFWDDKFILSASEIYKYRFKIINFIKLEINKFINVFNNKINTLSFIYISKVDESNIKDSLKIYLNKNIDRDILLKKTYIWPHVDDFNILIDNFSISDFASRWEIKSIILWLKQIEIDYIEKTTWIKPILIIDDLLSELDNKHERDLLEKMNNYQTFISSIKEDDNFIKIIKL